MQLYPALFAIEQTVISASTFSASLKTKKGWSITSNKGSKTVYNLLIASLLASITWISALITEPLTWFAISLALFNPSSAISLLLLTKFIAYWKGLKFNNYCNSKEILSNSISSFDFLLNS